MSNNVDVIILREDRVAVAVCMNQLFVRFCFRSWQKESEEYEVD